MTKSSPSTGKGYALMSLKVTLSHILRHYRITGDWDKMQLKVDVMLKSEGGHHISMKRRQWNVNNPFPDNHAQWGNCVWSWSIDKRIYFKLAYCASLSSKAFLQWFDTLPGQFILPIHRVILKALINSQEYIANIINDFCSMIKWYQ